MLIGQNMPKKILCLIMSLGSGLRVVNAAGEERVGVGGNLA